MAADAALPAGGEVLAGGLVRETARAKVNLFLHLRGRREDGYHLLESLAVFPALGDAIEAEPSRGLSLSIGGPFGDCLAADGDNLVLKAAAALAGPRPFGAALRLEKTLPVASGIGGGSADAAAALRALSRLWEIEVPEGLALSLGADVPVCMEPHCQWMGGIGERLAAGPELPSAWMVLVNPLVGVPTGAVFARLERRDCPASTLLPAGGVADFAALTGWLAAQRNDLEAAACALCPQIGEVLAALSAAPLARMSGSGATCFALLPDAAAADALAAEIRAARPAWWVASSPMS